ncbi:unnamed protein product [Larinioides sclopetarius]|uniref:Uncharacterized protein n=1 Tax=Larinioides sclopetarius TaxID=280406 RepID=A0AAV2BS76_9ARAC
MAFSDPVRRLYPVEDDFISVEDLKETERLLGDLKCSQSKISSHFLAWVEQRAKSIEAIGRFEKKLENLHRRCNAAYGVGSAMQAAGGLAMVSGAVLTACGQKTVGEFLMKKASTATVGTGVATTLSSSLAEMGLTHQTMKEVKMVLEKDEKYTKIIVEDLQHSRKIDSDLRRIFNCSILSDNILDVVRLVREGISLLKVGYVAYSEFDELIRKASKSADTSELTEIVIKNVYTTMKKVLNDPKAREAVWNICDIIQQSPSAFEFIKLGLRISFHICDILKVDIITSLLSCGILTTSAGVLATKCLLGAILIAVNVFSVINAIQDAKEGTSKYSKMLKELNLALTMELNAVNHLYMHPKLL